jgi:hypothetical protein
MPAVESSPVTRHFLCDVMSVQKKIDERLSLLYLHTKPEAWKVGISFICNHHDKHEWDFDQDPKPSIHGFNSS